ncbi:MAG TPA: dihydrolipoamide acetyltransferase family protein [Armatimonadota bacterium]|jgi:pyruvate dehydrogenase E2 component (dihydrolipoamide acetyltransferase)
MGIVNMPKMGDTMQEGTIAKWYKSVGDIIKEGEVIAEIETEKAAIEIEAFDSGPLTRIILQEGETAPVGAPIAEIGGPGGSPAPQAAPKSAPPEGAPPSTKPAEAAPIAARERQDRGRLVASPLARRIAKSNGVDLAEIRGSGPGGRIVAQDVENHVHSRGGQLASPRGAAEPAFEPSAAPTPPAPAAPGEVWVAGKPYSKMRQIIARRLGESKQRVPHFYVTADVDMKPAMELREQLNARGEGFAKLSPNDLVVKAVADSLRAQPAMRVSFGGDYVLTTDHVHVGIAVALTDGLIVPVLRDVDRMSLNAIAVQSRALAEKARAGKLLPDEFTGGTFTISNMGMFGVTDFMAIVNPPEPGILAIGAVMEVPVVENGQVVPGIRMKATLSADHRAVDGAVGAQFLQEVKRRLENPLVLVQ